MSRHRLIGTAALSLIAAPVAAAERFVVRSTLDASDVNIGDDVCDADTGPATVCTLRAAIQEANADGDRDRITFRIGGSNATGVKVIQPAADLPSITEPLEIDGYTQPTARPSSAGRGSDARILLQGPGAAGLRRHAPVEVRGLAIRDHTHGIEVHSNGASSPGTSSGRMPPGPWPGPASTGSCLRRPRTDRQRGPS